MSRVPVTGLAEVLVIASVDIGRVSMTYQLYIPFLCLYGIQPLEVPNRGGKLLGDWVTGEDEVPSVPGLNPPTRRI